MSLLNAIPVDEIRSRGTITSGDVMALRRAFYDDGAIDAAEAAVLFGLNSTCKIQEPGWIDCFVEMLTDHVVNQTQPEGYLTIENAEWLVGHIAPNGTVETKAELELLVTALDKARWSPQSLAAFALEQVKRAVVEGRGPLREGKADAAGSINEAEVEILKRILYAFGGDGNIAITQAEAEILFEIEAATIYGANADSWADLFVKAIANCVMSASGYATPSREQALARESWLERRGDLSLSSMAGAARTGGMGGILSAYSWQSSEQRAIATLERQKIEIVTADEVTPAEAAWLAARIGQDGKASANELALIAFLRANGAQIAPELDEMLGRLSAAA